MQHQTKNHEHHVQSPQSHLVVFRDQSAGLRYLTRSTRTSVHTTTWEDGNVYPVVEVDLSSAAHLARQRERHPQRELAGAAA